MRQAADQDGVAVLLVEQHVRKALDQADRAYVMRRGEIVLSGTAEEVGSRTSELVDSYVTAPSGGAGGRDCHLPRPEAFGIDSDTSPGRREPQS